MVAVRRNKIFQYFKLIISFKLYPKYSDKSNHKASCTCINIKISSLMNLMLHSWTIRDQNNENFVWFYGTKMKSFPSKFCFLYNCGDKHHMLYFKIQISRDARQREFLSSKTGDKAGTWIKGLKRVSNNFTLPDRATFHSTISMCLRQYLAEILPSCVNIYHTFQFVYQRCKFHPRPHISGHCFQLTANFPTKVLALVR